MTCAGIALLLAGQIQMTTDFSGTYSVVTQTGERARVDAQTGRPIAIYIAAAPYQIQRAQESDDWAGIDFRFRVADGYEAYRSKHEADRTGEEWVKQIFRLPGVEQMEVRQHAIKIRKADGFSWSEILAPAAEIVVRARGGK